MWEKQFCHNQTCLQKLMPAIDMGDVLTCPCLHYTWDYLMTGIGCFIKPTVMENGGYSIQTFTQLSYNYVFTAGYKVCFFNIIIFWAMCGAIYINVYFDMSLDVLAQFQDVLLLLYIFSFCEELFSISIFSTLPKCLLVTSPFTFEMNWLALRYHSTHTECALVTFERYWLVLVKTLVLLNELIAK